MRPNFVVFGRFARLWHRHCHLAVLVMRSIEALLGRAGRIDARGCARTSRMLQELRPVIGCYGRTRPCALRFMRRGALASSADKLHKTLRCLLFSPTIIISLAFSTAGSNRPNPTMMRFFQAAVCLTSLLARPLCAAVLPQRLLPPLAYDEGNSDEQSPLPLIIWHGLGDKSDSLAPSNPSSPAANPGRVVSMPMASSPSASSRSASIPTPSSTTCV